MNIRDLLKPAPYNPRRIDETSFAALGASMETFGDLSGIVWNRQTGNLVAGHQRISSLLERFGESSLLVALDEDGEIDGIETANGGWWPVRIVDWDLAKERRANVSANSPFIQGEFTEELEMVMLDIEADTTPEEMHLLALDAFRPEREPSFGDASDEIVLPGDLRGFEIKHDMVFKSDLPMDFPPIRDDMLASPPEPIRTWVGDRCSGESPHYLYNYGSDSVRGLDFETTVMAFYTSDERWERVIYDDAKGFAAKCINNRVHSLIGPNFSTWWNMPQALRIWSFYKNRWVSRFWQECGLRVIPDLSFPPEDLGFCFIGIPKNAPCLATQWQTSKDTPPDFFDKKERGLLKAMQTLTPECLLIYGHSSFEEHLREVVPQDIRILWVKNRLEEKHGKGE